MRIGNLYDHGHPKFGIRQLVAPDPYKKTASLKRFFCILKEPYEIQLLLKTKTFLQAVSFWPQFSFAAGC